MAYYNNYYTYPDIRLWEDATWENTKAAADPFYREIERLLGKEATEHPYKDHFAGRHDEVHDAVNHAAYFPDVVARWKKAGLVFSCYGMMGLQMVPAAVDAHRYSHPKVLFVPIRENREDPHAAMNVLEENADLLTWAAKEQAVVQFSDCSLLASGAVMERAIETQGTYLINYDPVYLDVSVLTRNGVQAGDVPGFDEKAWGGHPALETFGGHTFLDITRRWEVRVPHQYSISRIYFKTVPEWDYDRHIRSLAGKRQAEAMRLEADYDGPHDPKMAAFWKERGIRYEDHQEQGLWYVTLTPECLFREADDFGTDNQENRTNVPAAAASGIAQDTCASHKIPLLVTMKEPRTAVPWTMQTAFEFYYDFIEICARGEFMMLFFALETPADNETYLPGILRKTMKEYPVDPTRIYLTGQSHNGYYALEFYRQHPELIAAAATLCDPVGLQSGARVDYYKTRADEIVASFRQHDYPLIDINGNLENSYQRSDRTKEKIEEDAFYLQNRLKAWHLKERSSEEIRAAQTSPDRATRRNGVPSDRTQIRYLMGSEAYISDYQNEQGKWHFRYISLENTPHMIMPQMAELSWEFLRRFARDPRTLEIIERDEADRQLWRRE